MCVQSLDQSQSLCQFKSMMDFKHKPKNTGLVFTNILPTFLWPRSIHFFGLIHVLYW